MCVLAFAWQAHPRWQLIMAGNRDELHARPTAALAPWQDEPGAIIAGRDLQSGGTWLGISAEGRFAVVTNLRGHGQPEPHKASRGALVADYLKGAGPYDADAADLTAFNPFNLIVADRDGACFLTNQPAPVRAALAPGIYGLSNGAFDEPWPKTMQLKAALTDWLIQDAEQPERLFETLRSETLPDFGLAPDKPSDVPHEPRLSPIFIRNPVYGTRCSTVVAIDRTGEGEMIERRFAADGALTGETRQKFRWLS